MTSLEPKVSIGLPIYNGERYLKETLDCLLNQTFENFEIIISDNASEDGTSAICQSYTARHQRVRYHRNPFARLSRHDRKLGIGPGIFLSNIAFVTGSIGLVFPRFVKSRRRPLESAVRRAWSMT